MPSDAHRSEPPPRAGRRRVLLVGAFRSVRSEGDDGPFGSQGGFVDTLGPEPYSLATGYLQAFAEADRDVRARWTFDRLDLAHPLAVDDEREEFELEEGDVQRVLSYEPDLVALSAYCWNEQALVALAEQLRARAPDVRVVLGGRATDGDVDALLSESPALDALVLGEGELALRELLRRDLDPAGIPGVVWRRAGRIERGPRPVSIAELDEIPSPYAAGILAPSPNAMMLELSRGCVNGCGYCSWNADKRLRFFGAARIEAEVGLALARGHRHVTLNDSAINYDTERLRAAVDAIGRADPRRELHFTYNVRHELVDAEQLAILSRLPTHTILLGVESFSPGAMAECGRVAVDRDRLRATLCAIAGAVRPPVASIILGMPGDDAEGFIRTLEALLEWTEPVGGKPPAIGAVLVSLLQIYPGSPLWRRRGELGLELAPGIPYLLEGPGFPARDLAAAKAYLVRRMAQLPDRLKAAEAIALMESRGGLHPWLAPSHVESLLHPWKRGEVRGGWALTQIRPTRDTGRVCFLRFGWAQGGEARVRLTLREPGTRSALCSHGYDIEVEPIGPAPPPAAVRSDLGRRLRDALVRGERRAGLVRQPPGSG